MEELFNKSGKKIQNHNIESNRSLLLLPMSLAIALSVKRNEVMIVASGNELVNVELHQAVHKSMQSMQ